MCASMASNIYHPLPAFYFILVAVIWCSASVTRRFADRSYFAFRTSVLAFSLTDCVWGSVICGQIAVLLAVRHLLCDIFFFTLVLSSRPSAIIWPGAAVQIIDAAVRNIGNRGLSKAALWLCLRRYAPPPCSSPVPSCSDVRQWQTQQKSL